MPLQNEILFKDLYLFASQAEQQILRIDDATFEAALSFGEAQLTIKNGRPPSLEEALEVEGALRKIRALKDYAERVRENNPKFEPGSAIKAALNGHNDKGDTDAS